ncbi:MAG: transglutaminase family protein [Candidatus Heimdallarchaeota archaeon]
MKMYEKLRSSNREKPVVILIILVLYIMSIGTFTILHQFESSQELKGKASFQLNYRFRLTNNGPQNLTSLTVRLALLKDWNPVQNVTALNIRTPANFTTTDEYENSFAWYNYENFNVNQSLDLQFDANLTLNILDFSNSIKDSPQPYDEESEEYRLFTAYHPLTDTSDPSIQLQAERLKTSGSLLDSIFKAYNFTSSYINYRLLSSSRGASFAVNQGYGDCDEYTTLFVALSRSFGIPAIEHTAWLADFFPGFQSLDEGAIAHAYPMFYLPDTGFLPVDPTRGHVNLYDNWLKSDERRITLTRGPDHPYRLLRYRWIPQEGISNPNIQSNYSITILNMKVDYFSIIRPIIITGLITIPLAFVLINIINGYRWRKKKEKEIQRLLIPA